MSGSLLRPAPRANALYGGRDGDRETQVDACAWGRVPRAGGDRGRLRVEYGAARLRGRTSGVHSVTVIPVC